MGFVHSTCYQIKNPNYGCKPIYGSQPLVYIDFIFLNDYIR